jgi:tetratricopeptide (TPR) repeat protein
MHPGFDKGWLALATLKEQAGHLEDAIKGYATFLEISGRNPEIERHLFGLTIKQNMSTAHNNIISARQSPYESAMQLYERKQYKNALTQIDKHLTTNPSDIQARLFKIQILSALKDFTQAINLVSSWFDQEPHKKIWAHTLFLLLHTGVPHTKIATSLSLLSKKHPHSPWPTLYLADLAIRTHNRTQAITYLTQSLPHIKNKKLTIKTLHQLALLYFEQQDYTNMTLTLEQAYAQSNKFAPVANDLAYHLATTQEGGSIERAQQLISQALEQDKNNPLYIDTQAIIYFKQKKYQEAEQLLQPLQTSTNPTILLNLAQIKYALNNKDDARSLTEKAAKYVTLTHEKESLKKMQDLLQQQACDY